VRPRRLLVLIAALCACSAAVASGVTYVLVRHAEHQALPPIAFTGVLRDTSGKPVAGAWVQLVANDYGAATKQGEVVPSAPLAGVRTDAAGRFTIRQTPSLPVIRKLAAENYGFVNFDVSFSVDRHEMPWRISLKPTRRGWIVNAGHPTPATRAQEITFKPLPGP
jgi:hypothetical protein